MSSVRKELRHELRRHGVIDGWPGAPTFIWRYTTGAHLDGERRTDAGWILPGREALTDYRTGRWSYTPRLARAAVRWVMPPMAIAPALSNIHLGPPPTFAGAAALAEYEGYGLLLGGLVLAWGGWKAADTAFGHQHRAEWVQPVHEGLAAKEVLNLPLATRPRTYLHILADYQSVAGPIVKVKLPKHFLGETGRMSLVEHVLRQRLDLYDPRFEWQLKGRKRSLTVWHGERGLPTQNTEARPEADVQDAGLWTLEQIRPVWEAVHPLLPALPLAEDPRKWVEISGPITAKEPAAAVEAGAYVRLELPSGWAGEARADIKRAVEEKLDIDTAASFKAAGSTPYAVFKRAPEPPRFAPLASLREQLLALPQGVVGIGLNTNSRLIKHRHDGDAPHVFHSGGTGAGKSTFFGMHMAQEYRKGSAHMVVCDGKWGDSLPFMEDIPGITICADGPSMWRGIEWVYAEMERRFAKYKSKDEMLASGEGPIYLYLEECNFYGDIFGDYWEEIAPKGAKKTPPIIKKLKRVFGQGRTRMIYAVASAQYFAAEIFGNSGLINFGGKGYCNFNAKAWSNTMAGVPRPRSTKLPGRGIWAVQDEYEAIQFAFGTPEELRSFALERTAPVLEIGPDLYTRTPVPRASDTLSSEDLDDDDEEYRGTEFGGDGEARPRLYAVSYAGDDDEDDEEVQDEVLVTLTQAVEMGIISISKNTAQKYAMPSSVKYDETFPKPAGKQNQAHLYRARELEAWESNRSTRGTGEVG